MAFKIAATDEFTERQERTLEGARILAERLCSAATSPTAGISVVTGGTDVHLVLVDLRDSELDGQQAEDRLHRIGITVNRNAVPFDPRPPMVSSGLRIGTPALATRGFGDEPNSPRSPTSSPRPSCAGTHRRASPSRNSAAASRSCADEVPAAHPLYPNLAPNGAAVMAEQLPEHPDFLWRNPDPKPSYDAVIVGGGGHGLATAYYLAKNHGMTNIAVLERGWLAGGNMARNTTIIRSNYLWDESAAIYEHSLKLWESLPEELEYDFLFSQRGVMNLAHTLRGRARKHAPGRAPTSSTASTPSGWTPEQVKELCPIINISDNIRYPVMGATYQPRAGIAKHDHVAWAFARKCDELGVDIIQNCEVTGFIKDGNRVVGVKTSRGTINTDKVGLCRRRAQLGPGRNGRLPAADPVPPAAGAGLRTARAGPPDRGDVQPRPRLRLPGAQGRAGHGRRASTPTTATASAASFHVIEQQMAAAVELFPIFARAHVLRTWGGIVDTTLDASPIVGTTPVENMFVNCGWGTGGFKGTPARRADLRPHHRHRRDRTR